MPSGCPLLTCRGAEGRLILELAALCHLGVAGLILARLRVCREGEQGVRGRGHSRPGWRCPLPTHRLQGQESSARAAPGAAGGVTVTCTDEPPAGKGWTRGGKVRGEGRQSGQGQHQVMGGRETVATAGTRLAEAAWGQGRRAGGRSRQWGWAGWGTGPALGTGLESGRGLPTVALFPAGAENFASIGAARERETSTPGYRPGQRRRGGQRGGTWSPAPPRAAVRQRPAGAAPGWATPARRDWNPVPGFGSRVGARTGRLPILGSRKKHLMPCPAPWQGPGTHGAQKQVWLSQTSPPHLHSVPMFPVCHLGAACRPSSYADHPTCSAQHHPLPVPRPPPVPRAAGAAPWAVLAHPVLRRAPQLGAGSPARAPARRSWGCWGTWMCVSMCKHPPSGTHTSIPCPTGGKRCATRPCPTARPRR